MRQFHDRFLFILTYVSFCCYDLMHGLNDQVAIVVLVKVYSLSGFWGRSYRVVGHYI